MLAAEGQVTVDAGQALPTQSEKKLVAQHRPSASEPPLRPTASWTSIVDIQ